MTLLELLVLSLATWRVSYLTARENGPFDSLTRVRKRYPLGGLMACPYCLSIWYGAMLYLVLQTAAAPLVYMLAASGGAMLLHRYTGGDHQ